MDAGCFMLILDTGLLVYEECLHNYVYTQQLRLISLAKSAGYTLTCM